MSGYRGRAATACNNFRVTDPTRVVATKRAISAGDGDCVALTATTGCGAPRWGDAMKSSASILDVEDDDIFAEEISDAALELAAAMVKDRTASLTIAFCSGLDECPRHLPRSRARPQSI